MGLRHKIPDVGTTAKIYDSPDLLLANYQVNSAYHLHVVYTNQHAVIMNLLGLIMDSALGRPLYAW